MPCGRSMRLGAFEKKSAPKPAIYQGINALLLCGSVDTTLLAYSDGELKIQVSPCDIKAYTISFCWCHNANVKSYIFIKYTCVVL